MTNLDTFTQAYITAALWSSTDDNCVPLDANYSIDDIAPETLKQMIADCAAFQAANWDDIADNLERAGVDFWLTRNGYGAGFWDGDWPKGEELTEACEAFGQVDLYVSDDGKIYQ